MISLVLLKQFSWVTERAMLGQELVKNCHREGSSARSTTTYDFIYFLYFRDDGYVIGQAYIDLLW